jgi:hypothetical protein
MNCNCPRSSYGVKHTSECYDALAAELTDMTADYHRWHDAYIELKYPGGGQRVAVTPDQARIATLEAALREIGRFCNVPTDSGAWSVYMMVPEELRPAALSGAGTAEPSICKWEQVDGTEYETGCTRQSWHLEAGLVLYEFCPFCGGRIEDSGARTAKDGEGT